MTPIPRSIIQIQVPAYNGSPKQEAQSSQAASKNSELVKPAVEIDIPAITRKSIYSNAFRAAFHRNNENAQIQKQGLKLLKSLSPSQICHFPLFDGACIAYQTIIMTARRSVGKLDQPDSLMEVVHETELHEETGDTAAREVAAETSASHVDDPAFYHPVDSEGSRYSKQFYATFHQDYPDKSDQQIGLMLLEEMSINEQARLPLYKGACAAYDQTVRAAIQSVLSSTKTDDETLSTKRQIMICASRHRIQYCDLILRIKVNFDKVNCMGLNLAGLSFHGGSLKGTNFSFVDLRDVELLGTTMNGAIFTGARLQESQLQQLVLSEVILAG